MCDGVAGGTVITYIIISMRLLNWPSWLVGCDKAISTRAFERKHSWAARLTPRWPQFPVLQRFKDPNYHCTCVYHFLISKEKKFKLGQAGVGSNISQNHSSSIQGVISGHYLAKCIWTVDQKRNYVKWTLLDYCSESLLVHWTSYLVIIFPNAHVKLTKREFTSSWSWFEHCSESLI